jgi:hypothetical protein
MRPLGQTTVYARHEPTTDKAEPEQVDVVIYATIETNTRPPIARFPWYDANKPTKRHRTLVLNGIKNGLQWLPKMMRTELPAKDDQCGFKQPKCMESASSK